MVIGHVDKFTAMKRGNILESLPNIVIDGCLEVVPPRNGEILFWKIRDLFFAIRDNGIPIRWITYDSFQSADSLQLPHVLMLLYYLLEHQVYKNQSVF